jgi:hypothetical protein
MQSFLYTGAYDLLARHLPVFVSHLLDAQLLLAPHTVPGVKRHLLPTHAKSFEQSDALAQKLPNSPGLASIVTHCVRLES